MKFDELQPHIKRRVDFLLSEARAGSPRDQVITYTMRVLSNHASIGSDDSSMKIKELNQRISKAAYDSLLEADDFVLWAKNTINEHPKPLEVTWRWVKENAYKISAEEIWKEFCEYRMVTVLKYEDDKMPKRPKKGDWATIDFENRYSKAGITIVELDRPPKDIWQDKKWKK